MRVLLVTLMPPRAEAPGAIPVLLYATLTGLRARGHDVTVLTLFGDDEERAAVDALRADGFVVHPVEHRRAAARGLGRATLATRWLRGEPKRTLWFWEPAVQGAIDRVAAAEPFDVIQVEDSAMGVYRYPRAVPTLLIEYEVRVARRLSWRRVGAARRDRGLLRGLTDELDWQRWPRYQRAVWRRFDRVQLFSTRDAAAARALAPDCEARLRVNPFGVVIPPAVDEARGRPDTLLFVGNFLHPPNVDAARWMAAEILPRVHACRPDARLLIVGDDPHGLVRDLAGDRVELLGHVPSIVDVLSRAAVVVAPLRIGGGQRMKVLHAMAAGRAVVTTARGAEGLSALDAAPPLVVADDAPALAESAARLLADDAERRALGVRARAFVVEHASPDAYARRLARVYEDVWAAAPTGARP